MENTGWQFTAQECVVFVNTSAVSCVVSSRLGAPLLVVTNTANHQFCSSAIPSVMDGHRHCHLLLLMLGSTGDNPLSLPWSAHVRYDTG